MAQVMQERYADESAESTAILKEIQNFLEQRVFRYAARVWMLEKVDDSASFSAITQDLAGVVFCVVEPALVGPADSHVLCTVWRIAIRRLNPLIAAVKREFPHFPVAIAGRAFCELSQIAMCCHLPPEVRMRRSRSLPTH